MCATAMCLGGLNAQADDFNGYLYIEDLSIAPGETKPLTVWVNHDSVWWEYMITKVILPKGLVIEKLDPEEIDPEKFTLNYLYLNPQQNPTEYVALSTAFTDRSYWESDEVWQQLIEEAKQDAPWCENLETTALVGYSYSPDKANAIVMSDNIAAHFGEYPVVQYRVRATDELEDGAVITTRVSFSGWKTSYLGQDMEQEINGKEMTFRVRRVDPQPEMNYDVNGDGNVDIDDVNAVINALLKK